MIKNCRHPEQCLAVEKPEYKEAIEKYLVSVKLYCAVMLQTALNSFLSAASFRIFPACMMNL